MNATVDMEHGCDTEAMNVLLRGELSAVETYTQAIERLDDVAVISELQLIRDEHARAVRELRDQIVEFAGNPATSADVWSTFAAIATEPATVLGPSTVLAALKQGEENEISEYEVALENDAIHSSCKYLIRSDILPTSRRHVEGLDRLLGGLDN